jgi:hypothetical protein
MPERQKRLRVFISHSSSDKEAAKRIAAALEEKGIRPWLDEAEIRVGQSIPDKIAEGISDSNVFCILISEKSAISKWVSREYNSFLPRVISGEAAVVPCRLDNAPVPTLLGDIKYADFSVSFEFGLEQLLKAVKIREAAQREALIDAETRKLFQILNQAEIQWLVDERSKGRIWYKSYLVGDPGPWELLDKLCEAKLIEGESEPGGVRCFFLTSLGKLIVDRLRGR